MSYGTACKVYEQIAVSDLAAQGIRPGGLFLTERALYCCKFPLHSVLLDVGCGTGITLDCLTQIHQLSAIGIDASSVLLDLTRMRNKRLALVRATGEKLPFPDECADGVFTECSLSVMNDPGGVLDEIRRVLKIGGRLILSDVYARNPGGVPQLKRIPLECCLRGAVCQEEVLGRLTARHFSIDLWEDHSDLLTSFAVQLIFSYGSMGQFWLRSSAAPVDAAEIRKAVSEAKPGYFLLIARKIASVGKMPEEGSQ